MSKIDKYYHLHSFVGTTEKRDFEPDHEMDDWYEAEREITNIYRYWFQ